MRLSILQTRFQNTCQQHIYWQENTPFSQAIHAAFDQIRSLPLNDKEKAQVFKARIDEILESNELNPIEKKQADSLDLLLYNRFPEDARRAIANDLRALFQEPVPA